MEKLSAFSDWFDIYCRFNFMLEDRGLAAKEGKGRKIITFRQQQAALPDGVRPDAALEGEMLEERGCVVLDQPQHSVKPKGIRLFHASNSITFLRLVFDTAAFRGQCRDAPHGYRRTTVPKLHPKRINFLF